MKVVGAAQLPRELEDARGRGDRIGFVPTMGALHEGHLSLIRRAREENDIVVVSVFINPLQFGPSEDFDLYPRDLDTDAAKADEAGADLLFAPSADEMYPEGEISSRVDPGPIGERLEGHFRPGFFVGVATVCVKLFNLVRPTRAYFGEKDAQQLAVIKQVVRELDIPLEIIGCPTIREDDGLAMSSRNTYLDPEARRAAAVLSRALFEAKDEANSGQRSAEILKKRVIETVRQEGGVELQYVEVVDQETFQPIDELGEPSTIALAAFVGGARLIDNVTIRRQK